MLNLQYLENHHLIQPVIKKLARLAKIVFHELDHFFFQEFPSERQSALIKEFKVIFKKIQDKIPQMKEFSFDSNFLSSYSQLVCFGWFFAWIQYYSDNHAENSNQNMINNSEFSIMDASKFLQTNWVLLDVLHHFEDTYCSICKVSPKIEPQIKEIDDLFRSIKVQELHLYEILLINQLYSDFIGEFNISLKKEKGTIYTPGWLVEFIIDGLDSIIKQKFNINEGIMYRNLLIVDPAAGTMAFFSAIIKLILQILEKNPNFINHDKILSKIKSDISQSLKNKKIKSPTSTQLNSILMNFFAYEILMVPYILGIEIIIFQLLDLGIFKPEIVPNWHLFLTNSLENPKTYANLQNSNVLSKKSPILAVVGNPPYSASSQNNSLWINELVSDYIAPDVLQREGTKKISGLKSMKDDYIKFFRLGQYLLENSTEKGIIAFVTNNYFLDGLAARGMRKNLIDYFDEIWVINLHGDWKKNVSTSSVSKIDYKDENIFGIGTGIALIFMIKNRQNLHEELKKKGFVHYAESRGSKINKITFLEKGLFNIPFQDLIDNLDHSFIPTTLEPIDQALYSQFTYLPDIFHKHIQGIISGNDHFIGDVDKERLICRLSDFFEGKITPNTKSFDYAKARNNTSFQESIEKIVLWQYRGFDKRYLCYNRNLLVRDRNDVMQFLTCISEDSPNYCLVINRQSRGRASNLGSSYFISNTIADNMCNEGASGLHSYIFPLTVGHSNIRQNFINYLAKAFNSVKNLENSVFYYIYAILYAPSYRKTYCSLLKKDFPRIPFTQNLELFEKIVFLGKILANNHLFKDITYQEELVFRYFPLSMDEIQYSQLNLNSGNETLRIIKPYYDEVSKRIYFRKQPNRAQKSKNTLELNNIFWIGNIKSSVWNFQIGGIHQLSNWLKSRQFSKNLVKNHLSRGLTKIELLEFLRICVSINETIVLQQKIDFFYIKLIESPIFERFK